jgi:hypothetical protein
MYHTLGIIFKNLNQIILIGMWKMYMFWGSMRSLDTFM